MAAGVAPTQLVVVQPTPFCNIDCDYCYLPDRLVKTRMSQEVVAGIVEFLQGVPEMESSIGVVWHAGEPLVAPVTFYEPAFEQFARLRSKGVECQHHFQTNGTLIDGRWCTFFQRHNMRIGISVDGPQVVHDRHRKDRRGRGTFERTMRGASLLTEHEIPYSVISVLSLEALARPEEFCDFIDQYGITNIGFNVEEVEGAHLDSTLMGINAHEAYAKFFTVLYDFALKRPHVRIREFADTRALIMGGSGGHILNSENTIGSILSFTVNGDVSTFSPELLTAPPTDRYGAFSWANVASDDFDEFVGNVMQSRMYSDLLAGVEACEQSCDYFGICGGGPPSNKLAEHGTVASTETMCCRLRVKTLTDVVLPILEAELGIDDRVTDLPA